MLSISKNRPILTSWSLRPESLDPIVPDRQKPWAKNLISVFTLREKILSEQAPSLKNVSTRLKAIQRKKTKKSSGTPVSFQEFLELVPSMRSTICDLCPYSEVCPSYNAQSVCVSLSTLLSAPRDERSFGAVWQQRFDKYLKASSLLTDAQTSYDEAKIFCLAFLIGKFRKDLMKRSLKDVQGASEIRLKSKLEVKRGSARSQDIETQKRAEILGFSASLKKDKEGQYNEPGRFEHSARIAASIKWGF